MGSMAGALWLIGTALVQTPSGALPEELQGPGAQLLHGPVQDRAAALTDLLASGDSRVIPLLCEALGREDEGSDQLRRGLTLGLVGAFPEQAYWVLDGLTRGGNERQRETATYGLGHVPGERSVRRAIEIVEGDTSPGVRQAASYALVNPVRIASQHAYAYAMYQAERVPPAATEAYQWVLTALAEALERCHGAPSSELSSVILRVADPRLAEQAMHAFGARLAPSDAELVGVLARAQRVNRGWLGRAGATGEGIVEYQFHMTNVVADKTREIPLRYGPMELALMRTQGQHLDRATRWEMPLDDLLTCPAACAPRLESSEGERARVRYQLPRESQFLVGMGTLNIVYWQGRVTDAREAVVEFDATGVPVSESFLAEDQRELARCTYQDYVTMSEGRRVPTLVQVEMMAAQPQGHHLRFDLRFGVLDAEVWHLRDASVIRLGPAGEEVLALAHVSDLRVTPVQAGEGPR